MVVAVGCGGGYSTLKYSKGVMVSSIQAVESSIQVLVSSNRVLVFSIQALVSCIQVVVSSIQAPSEYRWSSHLILNANDW